MSSFLLVVGGSASSGGASDQWRDVPVIGGSVGPWVGLPHLMARRLAARDAQHVLGSNFS